MGSGPERATTTDPDVIDAKLNMTINVTNVNEAPTVSGDATATFVGERQRGNRDLHRQGPRAGQAHLVRVGG